MLRWTLQRLCEEREANRATSVEYARQNAHHQSEPLTTAQREMRELRALARALGVPFEDAKQ